MIKHFNETIKEDSKLKLGTDKYSVLKITPRPEKLDRLNERLLTTEAIDLMLMNCEHKLIKLNEEVVENNIQSIDTPHQNKILLVNQKDLSSLDRLKSAIKRYRYHAQLNPDSAIVQTNLGKLYHKNQQWQEAICCYQKAIAIDDNYLPARQYLAQIINR